MIVNAIRCPASNMRATMRRFDCTARSCLWLMQIDRSLCMKHVISIDDSSTTCTLRRRITKGTRREYTRRLLWSRVRIRPLVAWARRPTAHPNGRGARDRSAVAIRVHAPEPLPRARSVVKSMSMAGSRACIARRLTCYSPRSMSLNSRNGSALGRAEASCRIAS
jgi:hypothetical protein